MRVPGSVDDCIYVMSATSPAASRRTNTISQSFEHPLKPGLEGLPVGSSGGSRGIPLLLRHACAGQPRLSTFELAAGVWSFIDISTPRDVAEECKRPKHSLVWLFRRFSSVWY